MRGLMTDHLAKASEHAFACVMATHLEQWQWNHDATAWLVHNTRMHLDERARAWEWIYATIRLVYDAPLKPGWPPTLKGSATNAG